MKENNSVISLTTKVLEYTFLLIASVTLVMLVVAALFLLGRVAVDYGTQFFLNRNLELNSLYGETLVRWFFFSLADGIIFGISAWLYSVIKGN